MAKFLIILMAVAAAVLAYPVEDEVGPPNAVGTQASDEAAVPVPLQEQGPSAPGASNPEGLGQEEAKPEGTDLKTDSSIWWGWGPPVVYARSYYRPRPYGYYPYYGPYYYW